MSESEPKAVSSSLLHRGTRAFANQKTYSFLDLGFRVSGLGFRVSGLGFRV